MANEIRLTLEGSQPETWKTGTPVGEVLAARGGGERQAVAAKVNGRLLDLSFLLQEDATLEPVYPGSPEGREIFRHSTSHIMAQAVKTLYPGTKITIGPAIEDGFYYDFDSPVTFTPEHLQAIEKKMQEIIDADLKVQRREISQEEAKAFFRQQGEDYKVEMLEEIGDGTVSVYEQGDFVDLCRGPHVPSTSRIAAFKLTGIAGAYWRGDEHNKMLQRIYGTSFESRELLEEHLRRIEEARKRDHRKLGPELDLFSIQEEAGPGLVFWHPKGARLRVTLEDFWRQIHYRSGYEMVFTPHLAKMNLWECSGHWDFYRENMFPPMELDGQKFVIKPMNCPFHILMYKQKLRSYRDLPIRWAELGTVYRYEKSGVLHGLMRVRGFTQDDAHIFCRQDHLEEEILRILDLNVRVLRAFGFSEYAIYLSTRPEKSVGSDSDWEKATSALRAALVKKGLPFEIDSGEGVFYGPKIDIKIRDALRRTWQCSTVQVDFNLPQRFELSYVASDGSYQRPIMIHRALLGSLERFLGVLIEHYGGAFPIWLAPVQAVVLSITDAHVSYGEGVLESLRENGLRAEGDFRNEKIGYKIREAQQNKIPYMLIIGNREVESGVVAVRARAQGDLGPMSLEQFIERIKKEVESQS